MAGSSRITGPGAVGRMWPGMCAGVWMLLLGIWFGGQGCRFPEEAPRAFLFLGHPYDWNDGYRLDPRLERLDYTRFDQVWLGGDVCSRLTERRQTLAYLDSLLDFSGGRLHWALGNHDVMFGNTAWISQQTGRPGFYCASAGDGLTLLVLNTNLFWMYPSLPPQEDCREKEAQWHLIRSVLDTIQASSHLIILHHHALLQGQKPDSLREAFNINARTVTMTCDSSDKFDKLVYPLLVEVQQRGVQVVLVGGDVGMRVKQFQYRTPEGIWLLGSGINNSLIRENAPEYVTNFDPDQVLLFYHYSGRRDLRWAFIPLDDLVDHHTR